MELEPFFVCYSEDCKQARKTMGGSDPDYSKDLARFAAFVAEEVHKLDPKAWVDLCFRHWLRRRFDSNFRG